MHISRITKNRKSVSGGRKIIDSRITEKINLHSRFTQSKNAHLCITKCKGEPHINVGDVLFKDDFQSILRSLRTLMVINIINGSLGGMRIDVVH